MAVYKKALAIIREFETNKDTAPYSIMHYSHYVTDVNSEHVLCSLNDPLTEGTNYRELATAMIGKFRNLAKNIAKSAPA